MSKPNQKITKFDRDNVRQINAEAEVLLRPLAEKYGLVLDKKRGCFGQEELPVLLQFLVRKEDAEGNAMTAIAQDFVRFAQLFGLAPTDLNREFSNDGGATKFRVTGLNRKAQKTPVIAENLRNGKSYRFRAEQVKFLLSLTKAA
jgi:hypothetical protein